VAFFLSINPDPCVQGDTPTYEFDITVEAGRSLAKAWMTLKTLPTDADPGIWQIAVTSFGTITTNADGTTTTQVFFKLTSTQSTAVPTVLTNYDVQVKLDNNDILTPVIGKLQSVVGYTTTTV
jgi:hypothetical protein